MNVVRTKSLVGSVACCVLAALFFQPAAAQDTHYWNNQYGPRSMLLGGSVIGSVHDMSATYYNPGALGYIADPELLLSANAYAVSSLTIKDGGGVGIDLETSDFNILPNMLAGAFRKSWLGKNKMAYSLLTRHRFDAEVKGGRTARADVLPGSPGDEDFAGAVFAGGEAKELWAGLTWAREAPRRAGFGITTYLSIRNHSNDSELFAQALSDSGEIALVYDIDNYSSTVYSLLWKAGVGIDLRPLTLGVTLTTPNVQLVGSGEAVLNSTVVNVDVDNDSNPDNSFETDFQEDVNANYETPWSVGVGAGLHLGDTGIHLSAEWFSSVDAYAVLELEPFVSQASGQTVTRTLQQQLDSVFNFAVGLEQKLGDKYSGYASFNTDNSAFNPESDVSVTGFDVYHVTAGGTALFKKTQWMLGLSYAWGSQTLEQAIDLNPGGGGAVIDPGDLVQFSYRRVTFLVGFTLAL